MTEVIEQTENKKGYKKTKLGWIPEDWEVVKIRDIVDKIETGVSVNSENRPAKNNEFGILKTSCVKNGIFRAFENKFILQQERKRAKLHPCRNCIIVSRMNTPELVGENAYVPEDYKNLYIPDRLWQIHINNKINSKCLSYITGSKHFKRNLKLEATGTSNSMKNIAQESFLSQRIICPTKIEQEKIVEFLSTWDDGIETLEKLIEQKEILKNSFAQKYFQRKNNLFQLKPYKLGELFTNRKETNCCDLELLSVCDGLGIIPRSQLNAKDNSNEDKSKYLKVCIGDLAYNTMRMWQGRCGVSSYEGIVSPAYTVCIPKNNIDVDYMYYLFKTPHMIHDFWRYSQGIVDDTLNLKFNNFEVIKVWIPDKETQTKIAKLLKSYDKEIQLLNSKLEKLKEQKKGLMQKLLTGQIRVKV